MRKMILLVFIFIIGLVASAFSQELYKAAYGPISLRSSPSPDAPKIGSIQAGEVVEAIGQQKHWIKVKYKGKVGWTAKPSFDFVGSQSEATYKLSIEMKSCKKVSYGKYKTFVSVRNVGNSRYKGALTINYYGSDNKLITQTMTPFIQNPLKPDGGLVLYAETKKPVKKISWSD